MSSELTAILSTSAWANWTSYSVDADVLTPAGAFTLEVAAPTAAQVAAITEGSALTLMVGSTCILAGWIETKSLSSSREGTRLSIHGRDCAAPLTDCSVPINWRHANISLAQLARLAVAELGLSLAVDADVAAEELIPHVHAEPGESFWELLERHARRRRCLIWSEPRKLRIGRPDYVSPAVGGLRRQLSGAENNVLSAEITWRVANRRSPVTVLGQASDGSGRVVGQATDAELLRLGLRRPLIVQDGGVGTTKRAKERAQWEVQRRAGEGWTGTYTVPGHGPGSGRVWEIDSVVDVLDEPAGVRGPKWIAARRLQRSRNGTTTTLTLRDLGAIAPP